ncbi:MAG: histidine--tRNA ligase, partial [Candidatus Sungbacteria bacterium RIFCSPHIGHO2_02_FULL_52_23]
MVKEVTSQKSKRVKPDLPGGFRDYGPADAIAKQGMIDVIRRTFESFGFDPLETSSVQKTEVLTGGEEDSGKIIFNIKGSQEETSDTSLRFDLTVPLARFVADNPEIPKPFKRYQIGNVWRGERQQAGRYREFMQADVDIVGVASLDADAEIAAIMYTAFKNLGVEKFIIKYNNRKVLNALPDFAGFPEEKLWAVLRIVDKQDKIGDAGMKKELAEELGDAAAEKIIEFIFGGGAASAGRSEYEAIRSMLGMLAPGAEKYFVPDFSLVRGLSYYTGSVFEVTLTDAPEIGSVCGGGRYDDLVAKFTGTKIPAVGVSIGVDRLFAALEKLGCLEKKETLTDALIFQLDEEMKSEYLAMARELRAAGVNTALYLGEDRSFQAQLAYAIKKGIPYAVIYGAGEKEKGMVGIKNLKT